MADDKQVQVFGDGTKDTNLEAGSCASCANYGGAGTPFVFTPINFTYTMKAKYIHATEGSENTLSLTPNKDVYAEFNLMSLGGINKGAVGKDAAQELMDYYNGTLESGGGPQMTKDFAQKVINEFHTELSKQKWKTFFEKAIKNSVKTENLLKSTFQDYINHSFITDHNRKAMSYEGWGKSSCEKTYTVKVNVGVKPKFLKSCSLEDDKSRLKVVSPEKKFCKAFLAITGEDKELSDDNFLFEVTDQYSEPSPRSFTSSSALGKIEDLNEQLITPSSMLQTQKDGMKLARDGCFGGLQAEVNGRGGVVQYDGERSAWSIGQQFGNTRVEVEADMSGGQMREDIYIRYTMAIGPQGQVGQTTITIGGRKASIGYVLQQIARNMQGWMYQVWLSWNKPSDPNANLAAEKAKEKAEKVKEETEKSKEKQEEAENEAGKAKQEVDGATQGNTDEAAAALAAAKAAAQAASQAAQAAQSAQNDLAKGEGSNPVTSNTNNQNVAKVVTESSEVLGYINSADTKLSQGNIAGAQTDMTQAVNKAQQATNSAETADVKAEDVVQSAKALVDTTKVLTNAAETGRDLEPGLKNVIYEVTEKIKGAKEVVKEISNKNKETPEDLKDKLGGALVPEGSNNATIPKTSTEKTDLQSETRIESNDNSKGTGSKMYEKEEQQTENPVSTFGSNKGSGYESDENAVWQNAVLNGGLIEMRISPSTERTEPQNEKFTIGK
jgi:hypothetical protein